MKLFFLHIPKTGGVTLNDYCLSQVSKTVILNGSHTFTADDEKYDFISGHFHYNKVDKSIISHDKFNYITVLRDPIEQLFSDINYLIKIRTMFKITHSQIIWELSDEIVKEEMTADRLKFILETNEDYFRNQQTLFLSDENRDIEQAMSNLMQFKLVGRLNEFSIFIGILRRLMEWPYRDYEIKNVGLNIIQRKNYPDLEGFMSEYQNKDLQIWQKF